MLSKHERHYDLGMDALVTVCSRNTNVIMIGHGCSGHRMLSKHERYQEQVRGAGMIQWPSSRSLYSWTREFSSCYGAGAASRRQLKL